MRLDLDSYASNESISGFSPGVQKNIVADLLQRGVISDDSLDNEITHVNDLARNAAAWVDSVSTGVR